MSIKSNNQGRAYEYICLLTLHESINKIRKSNIVKNSAFFAAQKAWNSVDSNLQNTLKKAADAIIDVIFEAEPMIIEDSSDILTLKIQTDNEGKEGDVRDILISRNDVSWEIGLSIKHNHFAVKHSRIGHNLDFGKKWFGVPCSDNYWNNIKPVFEYLAEQISQNKNWNELKTKNTDVYIPLLNAFMNEIKESTKQNPSIPQKMVEYLLGEFDFYKVISMDSLRVTKIEPYNLHGELNKSTKTIMPKITIPVSVLPTRIACFDFKPNSSNTVELYMDGGWQFNFRIHNASTKVEQSLKFDIQLIGMPTTIISINCNWR